MVNLQLPNIKGDNEREQLKQMQRYLYQLVEQLQFALDTVSVSESSSPVKSQMPVRVIQSSPVAMMSLERGLSDDQVTFQAIKPLIIKSADIINAYYEEINRRLESVYVAESDFGKFVEQNSQTIEETATDVTQRFENVQSIILDEIELVDNDLQRVKAGVESEVIGLSNELGNLDSKIEDAKSTIGSDIGKLRDILDELSSSLVEVNARIKTGLLYYDGETPVYGLEIGQENTINGVKVFNKFARFSAGRLAFYDQNGTEVAYISDYKLYITHAEVTGTLKLGGYLVDTSKGVTFKWVGRS